MKAHGMNITKENATGKFIEMIKKSWTYNRMTEKEKDLCILCFSCARGIRGTARQRWDSLHDIYSAFLAGLDYSPFGWRETDEEKANNPKF